MKSKVTFFWIEPYGRGVVRMSGYLTKGSSLARPCNLPCWESRDSSLSNSFLYCFLFLNRVTIKTIYVHKHFGAQATSVATINVVFQIFPQSLPFSRAYPLPINRPNFFPTRQPFTIVMSRNGERSSVCNNAFIVKNEVLYSIQSNKNISTECTKTTGWTGTSVAADGGTDPVRKQWQQHLCHKTFGTKQIKVKTTTLFCCRWNSYTPHTPRSPLG